MKSFLILLFLDIYGYYLNFFKYISSSKERLRKQIKQYIFENKTSYFATLSYDKKYKVVFDYENVTLYYLIYIYFKYIFGLFDIPNIDHQKATHLDNIKYCIFVFYMSGERKDVIMGGEFKNKDSSFDIAYALMDNCEVTNYITFIQQNICQIGINVIDMNLILKGMSMVREDCDDKLIVMDMNTMKEQIFKGNDIITL